MLNFPDMFALSCTLLYAASFRHCLSVQVLAWYIKNRVSLVLSHVMKEPGKE